MKRLTVILLICCWQSLAWGQSVIRGRVLDADTKEGIPFCSVFFEGTTIGTSSDLDGYYELDTKTLHDSLTVSAIGYTTLSKAIEKSLAEQEINFSLSAAGLTLEEVVVIAGENPANAIVRGIIANKEKNRIEGLNTYQYESYAKIELDLENINPKLQESKLMKPFAFVFENVDSTSDEKPFLPAYINESLSDVYYVQGGGKPKSIIKAQRTSGINNQTVIDYIKRIHQDYSIYDDWIYVLDKPFISPFAKSGLSYYEYYIIDSTSMNGHWSYQLKFKPKRKQEPTFFGDFWVADTSFAVQRANMRMSPDVNINLVSRIIIYEEFQPQADVWMPEKKKMVVDFTPTEGAPGMIARRTETFRDFFANQPGTKQQFVEKDEFYVIDDVEKDDDAFWAQARHEPLTKTEETIYAVVDSIQNVPIFKTYAEIIEAVFVGYFELGPVEIGPYSAVYSSNPVEGDRFRIGLRTSEQFSKELRLGGFLAYGLKDQDFKYGGEVKWLASKRPRTLLGAAYINDISLNSENSESFVQGDLFTGFLRRDLMQKLIRVEEGKFFYERYWRNGFSNRITILNRSMDPYGMVTDDGRGFNYAFLPNPATLTDVDTTINTTEIILKARFTKDEMIIDTEFDRTSFGSKYPIVELKYTLGVDGVMGSDYHYHKLELGYRHYFYLNPIGWMSYRINAGKVFGTVPFLLMEVHPGNEGYFTGREIFNMMTRYEFASDAYASILLEHHFDGFLLNKVPLLRKLNLREYATFKGVIGTISNANRDANRLNAFEPTDANTYAGFRTPSKRPYMEASIGIENILKVFQVEVAWRLTYLDNPQATRFGIRFGTAFYF
ncbi:MAG: carboxypeptidase-like regulatory domain-containing protein [Phaeodactylibacter sp.]|nr:carboxypeptidase-like regulatory domain-containing protein [Phaeodactylibacter sp.]MCB9272794.1 carboxypeptidase-like regulatory domain-containing protein [Lewinellaceae bacterium]